MKIRMLLALLMIVPFIGIAQTKDDYEIAISHFKSYYNRQLPDSLNGLFSEEWMRETPMDHQKLTSLIKLYGEMKSARYMGKDVDETMLFKTTFSKSVHIMALGLDEQRKIVQFHFRTNSELAEKLLKK